MFPVDYEQSLSIFFFWSFEQNAQDTQMTTCVTEGARRERLPPLFLASRGFTAQSSRACTPLTKSEEKERLLAVYVSCCYSDFIDFEVFCLLSSS